MILIHLADGFEEIEAITIVDVLRRAKIDAKTVSIENGKSVRGAHDIIVQADFLFKEVNYENCEMIVLPGGMPGTSNLGKHQGLATQLKGFAKEGKWLAAICAAPSILGNLGLLKGVHATSFPGYKEQMPGADYTEERVVIDGNIITSRGPGTAIEFSLTLVELLKDSQTSEALRKSMIL